MASAEAPVVVGEDPSGCSAQVPQAVEQITVSQFNYDGNARTNRASLVDLVNAIEACLSEFSPTTEFGKKAATLSNLWGPVSKRFSKLFCDNYHVNGADQQMFDKVFFEQFSAKCNIFGSFEPVRNAKLKTLIEVFMFQLRWWADSLEHRGINRRFSSYLMSLADEFKTFVSTFPVQKEAKKTVQNQDGSERVITFWAEPFVDQVMAVLKEAADSQRKWRAENPAPPRVPFNNQGQGAETKSRQGQGQGQGPRQGQGQGPRQGKGQKQPRGPRNNNTDAVHEQPVAAPSPSPSTEPQQQQKPKFHRAQYPGQQNQKLTTDEKKDGWAVVTEKKRMNSRFSANNRRGPVVAPEPALVGVGANEDVSDIASASVPDVTAGQVNVFANLKEDELLESDLGM